MHASTPKDTVMLRGILGAMIRQIAPQFFTTDMAATLAYYRDKLGFECLGTWSDPPVYAIVARDERRFHFRLAQPPTPNPDKYDDELLDAYVLIEDGTDARVIHADGSSDVVGRAAVEAAPAATAAPADLDGVRLALWARHQREVAIATMFADATDAMLRALQRAGRRLAKVLPSAAAALAR